MFWQLASMSGFLSFGSCAIGILRNLICCNFTSSPQASPKLFQLPISCRKTRSQPLGLQSEQLLPTRKHSPYFPITSDEAHCDCHPCWWPPTLSSSPRCEWVWENPRKRQFIPYTSLYEMLLGYISTSANIPYQTAL